MPGTVGLPSSFELSWLCLLLSVHTTWHGFMLVIPDLRPKPEGFHLLVVAVSLAAGVLMWCLSWATQVVLCSSCGPQYFFVHVSFGGICTCLITVFWVLVLCLVGRTLVSFGHDCVSFTVPSVICSVAGIPLDSYAPSRISVVASLQVLGIPLVSYATSCISDVASLYVLLCSLDHASAWKTSAQSDMYFGRWWT